MSTNERHARGQRSAGLHLQHLLVRPGPYRAAWEQHAHDARPEEIRQDAVGQVIADWLYETGERDDTDTGLARMLKDRISRAFGGRGLSLETLRWFEGAFALSRQDVQRVRELYRSVIRPTIITGQMPLPRVPYSAGHETTLLYEHHMLGRDGVPARHHTQQTFRALIDGMSNYQYRIDTTEADIHMVRGGTVSPMYRFSEELWAVDIQFHHPLAYGEEAYVDWWTIFRYSRPPETEFRRATHRRTEHLDLRIEFHPQKRPRRLWWTQWADYREPDDVILDEEEVWLDEEFSAHRYLEAMEHTVLGFRWEW